MFDYRAEVVKVIDGDTIAVRIDCGFHVFFETRLRLMGINTPEINASGLEGEEARDFVKALLPPGTAIRVETIKASTRSLYCPICGGQLRPSQSQSPNAVTDTGLSTPIHRSDDHTSLSGLVSSTLSSHIEDKEPSDLSILSNESNKTDLPDDSDEKLFRKSDTLAPQSSDVDERVVDEKQPQDSQSDYHLSGRSDDEHALPSLTVDPGIVPSLNDEQQSSVAELDRIYTCSLCGTSVVSPSPQISEKTEKYGRYLAIIWLGDQNVNDAILAAGHAAAYLQR